MDISEVTIEVLKSKKYSSIDKTVIERVTSEMLKKYTKKKDVIKAVKNELHIVHGLFLHTNCHVLAREMLSRESNGMELASNLKLSKEIMKLHSSTRERLCDAQEIYPFIGKFIESDSTIMDIGCGLNPFALPFYVMQPKEYIAYDINVDTVNLINSYFNRIQRPLYYAELFDVIVKTPKIFANTALLMKLLPLLQQQKEGRAISFLEELKFDIAIVSFPLQSVTGKQKGMELFYSSFMESNLPQSLQIVNRTSFSNELFYVLKRIPRREKMLYETCY